MDVPALAGMLDDVLPAIDEPWEDSLRPQWLLLRLAAVTVLLFPRDARASFLLIRRPGTMSSHAGQIALPGGRVELEDASPWEAALREAHEEIGVPPESVSPVGRLEPIQIAASNHLVLPFVGCMRVAAPLNPSREEVEAVIEVPVTALLDPENVKQGVWQLHGSQYRVVYFDFAGEVVWGATARILADLASRIGAVFRDRRPGHVSSVAG